MDPLALLPYALAAAGGRVGPYPATALVAAGVTLLQRAAPLVRALAGRRSAVLLPPGPAWLVALAASDGRGMVVLDDTAAGGLIRSAFDRWRVGAVFTTAEHRPVLPPDVPVVLLDEAPARARLLMGDRDQTIDLGTHFGLDLVGDTGGDGAPEECLVFAAAGRAHTHAEVLAQARATMAARRLTPLHQTASAAAWNDLDALRESLLAPLLAGGAVLDARDGGTAD